MTDEQPRMIPNPLWCDMCHGVGYVVYDTEWEPYAVKCVKCEKRKTYTPDKRREE